jgi:hypothetical protein
MQEVLSRHLKLVKIVSRARWWVQSFRVPQIDQVVFGHDHQHFLIAEKSLRECLFMQVDVC